MLIDPLITRSAVESGSNRGDFGSQEVLECSKEPDANVELEEAIAYFGGIKEVMAMFRAVEGLEAAAATLAAQ
jgi:hypothetical protein